MEERTSSTVTNELFDAYTLTTQGRCDEEMVMNGRGGFVAGSHNARLEIEWWLRDAADWWSLKSHVKPDIFR